jgi:hypothetical protein
MTFGALGDVHGDFQSVRRVMDRHPDIPFWVSVGDLGGDAGLYEEPPAALYWIKGNNEDFEFVARQAAAGGTLPLLRYVPNGTLVRANGLRLAGLGGTFAPTWYDTPASQLPYPRRTSDTRPPAAAALARDKRRHFVRDEVECCKRLGDVDVFLSHEAPRPFIVVPERAKDPERRLDAGKTQINEILTALRPRLHLFGHHHRFVAGERHGVPSICLDLVSKSYLLIESATMEYVRVVLA